jgi:hypothetical protein
VAEALPRQASWWNHSRNTSAVFQPPPNALPDARRALAILRRDHPDLVQWLLNGHPTMTEAEHFERFGVHYDGFAKRKRK